MSEKNIKDYLHLYLGCEVETEGAKIRTLDLDILKLSLIGNLGVVPILRPLSDMTEEEAIELVKLSTWQQYGDHPFEREYEAYKNNFGQIVVSWGYGLREKNVPVNKNVFSATEFKYLLSKHFDLLGLIDARLAIDKTKITQPKTA